MTPKVKKNPKNAGRKQKLTPEQIIKALEKTGGFVTYAANMLKVHYITILNYCKKYPEIQQARDQISESYIDLAENALMEKIKKGDTVSILFYLKCQAKHRGYVERQEITGAEGKDLLTFVDLAKKASE